jgi:ParB-like chromosome segregation protein Spo0J
LNFDIVAVGFVTPRCCIRLPAVHSGPTALTHALTRGTINHDNMVIAHHGRVEAAKLSGMEDVPTIQLENLTEEQVRAYVISDNRLAERAGRDRSILAIELQPLTTIDGDIEVRITGFRDG